ncbi:hypothetical protein DFH29DRAFT_1006150 [Suillus ampliporus]|nr:hypothetical protein DFH29DRAFT_1006150 [Suillus ampliporus]
MEPLALSPSHYSTASSPSRHSRSHSSSSSHHSTPSSRSLRSLYSNLNRFPSNQYYNTAFPHRCICPHNQWPLPSSQSACSIKEEDGFPGGMQLEFDGVSFYQAEEEDDHSDLALEAAKTKCKVCQAQKALADCILEHHMVLLDLYRRRVEAANTRLLTANLNIRCMHVERKKIGIATFVGSSSLGGAA